MGQTQNTLPRLRDDYKAGEWPSAREWNALAKLINGAKAYGSASLRLSQNGLHVGARGGGSAFPWSKLAFGYALTTVAGESEGDPSTTVCTIQPGAIRMHGAGVYYLDLAAEVTLDPMSEPWVYAQCPRGGGSVSILASSTEPISNASTLKIPLYQFERTTGGSYVLPDGGIHHIGDVNLDTPLL